MKLNNCTLSFKSHYKFPFNDNVSNIELDFFKMSNEQFQYDTVWSYDSNLISQGIYGDCYIWANDEYDKKIETILLNNGIKFKKTSNKEIVTKENILPRITQSQDDAERNYNFVNVDTKKFDEIFKQSEYYIGKYGEKGIQNRYVDFVDYLKSGKPINASTVTIYEENNEPKVVFIDGRHRYSVFRDLGFEYIPLSMSTSSMLVAEKYGLIKK